MTCLKDHLASKSQKLPGIYVRDYSESVPVKQGNRIPGKEKGGGSNEGDDAGGWCGGSLPSKYINGLCGSAFDRVTKSSEHKRLREQDCDYSNQISDIRHRLLSIEVEDDDKRRYIILKGYHTTISFHRSIMAFYSFPAFTNLYNPFAASHQFIWDDDFDEVRPSLRQRSRRINDDNNGQFVKSNSNDISNGSGSGSGSGHGNNHHDSLFRLPKFVKSFSPKFDVRETKEGYHLDGELPGIRQKDVEIEFTDPHTLLVKGEVKREYHATNAVDDGDDHDDGSDGEEKQEESTNSKSPEAQESASSASTRRQLHSSPHQATVEDTDEDGNPIAPAHTSESDKLVRKERSPSGERAGPAAKKAKKSHHLHHQRQQRGRSPSPVGIKYWVTERTTGSFHRTFSFPSKVNQDGVKASLKDGLLSVFVPKQKEQKGRKKITVE
ncbi:hypothetical protein KEM54_002641 [Ascosphaera aggregata]|nr:hypothetical protein KEM54_002641 [Ascosphaera aggregata]